MSYKLNLLYNLEVICCRMYVSFSSVPFSFYFVLHDSRCTSRLLILKKKLNARLKAFKLIHIFLLNILVKSYLKNFNSN